MRLLLQLLRLCFVELASYSLLTIYTVKQNGEYFATKRRVLYSEKLFCGHNRWHRNFENACQN
ncbi:MAG: hypothetical protein CVU91_06000 [Firmicutes bacterium HGW-Firmicutes-16]|nr:MAG: hypothetical protein CVU91_06000 [Firmicutes bacterium HGW-Firmicutes-16]